MQKVILENREALLQVKKNPVPVGFFLCPNA
jgi:hypothetical protein